jgi:hypothetical protein
MKPNNTHTKDRFVRAIAGFMVIVLLLLQKLLLVDLTIIIFCVGLNLFQYGISGWCPFAAYFKKIGWLENL